MSHRKRRKRRPLSSYSDDELIHAYLDAGESFGAIAEFIRKFGHYEWFPGLFEDWEWFEVEFAQRGYMPISLVNFTRIGAYSQSYQMLGINPYRKRWANEELILYTELYRKIYIDRTEPPLVNIFCPDYAQSG